MKNVNKKLLEVFGVLAKSPNMAYMNNGEVTIKTFSGQVLLHITQTAITTPVTKITDQVFQQKSPLPDAFVSMGDFGIFVDGLMKKEIKGLDHVGFCYTTDSQENELTRIKKALQRSPFYLYEMKSTDIAKWYFIGDRSHSLDPMVELLPAPTNNEPDLPFWMPHVQIDMETQYTAAGISEMIHEIFGNARKPQFQIDPGSGVYAVRFWLGTVSGVNVMLDIGTNIVDLEWVRKNMLYEI